MHRYAQTLRTFTKLTHTKRLALLSLAALLLATACASFGGAKPQLDYAPSPALQTHIKAQVGSEFQSVPSAPELRGTAMDASTPGSGVARSGAQDADYFRHLIDQGQVPYPEEITVEGLFAEYNSPLPPPLTERALTLHPLLGVAYDPRDGTPAAVLQLGLNSHIDFSGLPRLPMNLCVALDTSGSMHQDQKLDYVKEGLQLMLQSLGPRDTLSIVTYDTTARVVLPPTPVTNRASIHKLIEDIYPGGATNLYEGMTLGYQQVLANLRPNAVNRLMLLSDGVPTTGPTNLDDILRAARQYSPHRVQISTIGVGTDFNHELMLQLARHGGGNFYFLRDNNKVRTVFREELETVLTPIARDMTISLELDGNVALEEAHGLPLTRDSRGNPQIHIPTVYLSRRNGTMLFELNLGDILFHRGSANIGRIVFSYTLMDGNKQEVTHYPLHLPEWQEHQHHRERIYFEHPTIRRNFSLLMTAFSLQDACDHFHRRDPYKAQQILAKMIGVLQYEANELRDNALARELQTAQRLLANLHTATRR